MLPRKLDFAVEHRAGKKIAHVDAFSLHVGTVVQGGTLEKEDVLREEAKDTFCLKQSPGIYASRREIGKGNREIWSTDGKFAAFTTTTKQ